MLSCKDKTKFWLGFLVCEFYFLLLVPVADIKAIVTGKDCPHMKEKSALKQNKVSAPFLPVIGILCCGVEDCDSKQQEQMVFHTAGVLFTNPISYVGLFLVLICDCYRLFEAAQNTDTGKCTELQQGSFSGWVSRQKVL